MLQKIWPDWRPDKGASWIDITAVTRMSGQLQNFSKYLSEKGKSFETMTRNDIANYLGT